MLAGCCCRRTRKDFSCCLTVCAKYMMQQIQLRILTQLERCTVCWLWLQENADGLQLLFGLPVVMDTSDESIAVGDKLLLQYQVMVGPHALNPGVSAPKYSDFEAYCKRKGRAYGRRSLYGRRRTGLGTVDGQS